MKAPGKASSARSIASRRRRHSVNDCTYEPRSHNQHAAECDFTMGRNGNENENNRNRLVAPERIWSCGWGDRSGAKVRDPSCAKRRKNSDRPLNPPLVRKTANHNRQQWIAPPKSQKSRNYINITHDYTGWPQKVSNYQVSSLNRIKNHH